MARRAHTNESDSGEFRDKLGGMAVTFADVLLVPQFSDVTPDRADVRTRLTRNISLNIPLLSSPMDTVTESRLAIALALEGGMGIIHRNLSIEDQCREVEKVKAFAPDTEPDRDFDQRCTDDAGRLRVGAAVGVHDEERIEALIEGGVDVVVIDTAHGHSKNVLDTIAKVRKKFKVELVAGNIVTSQAAADLIDAGADALKVGVGPGSICTTRIVSGVGVPQLTAIMDVVAAAQKHDVPVIADGGIRHSGDITKAIGAGAHCVMLGSLFAGLEESPGETVTWQGRKFKAYRGMGSLGAMAEGSASRYSQSVDTPTEKFVPEGVEGRVPYSGLLADFVYQLVGGLKSGMGYCGTATIDDLRLGARFCSVSAAGVAESHPHDITMTRESPNYAP